MSRRCKAATAAEAFSLLELLMVIAVLGILMRLIMFAAGGVLTWSRVAAAETIIATVGAALEMYQNDMGAYPPTGNANLVDALANPAGKPAAWRGPYMQFRAQELQGTLGGAPPAQLLDPWRVLYGYQNMGAAVPPYRFFSAGPDGAAGTADDIKNSGW